MPARAVAVAVAESGRRMVLARRAGGPAYAKALTRRGAARIELKRYEEALGDAEAALELAPDNPELIKMREKVLKLLPQKVARVALGLAPCRR